MKIIGRSKALTNFALYGVRHIDERIFVKETTDYGVRIRCFRSNRSWLRITIVSKTGSVCNKDNSKFTLQSTTFFFVFVCFLSSVCTVGLNWYCWLHFLRFSRFSFCHRLFARSLPSFVFHGNYLMLFETILFLSLKLLKLFPLLFEITIISR